MQGRAQTQIIFQSDFEDGTFGEWLTHQNSTPVTGGDHWIVSGYDNISPVLDSGGSKLVYITSNKDDNQNTYLATSLTAPSVPTGRQAHLYRDVDFDENNVYVLSFDWKCGGSASAAIRAELTTASTPADYLPAGDIGVTTATTTMAITPLLYGGSDNTWKTATVNIDGATTGTGSRRLFISWICSNATLVQPPAAIDNIKLVAYPKSNTKTIALTAGTLSEQTGLESIISLTLTGTVNAKDFAYMRDNMLVLQTLDISGATITDYSGTEGTLTGSQSYPAGEIPQNAFNNGSAAKTFLKSVVLPATPYTIGASAFSGCTGLTGAIDLSKATAIGASAFKGCTGLTGTLDLSSATTIGNQAFAFASSTLAGKFDGVKLSNSLSAIGDSTFVYSFYNATADLTIPASVQSIGKYAFYYYGDNVNAAHALTFAAPSQLTSIDDNAFYNLEYFSSDLNIPASVKTIGANAFNSYAYRAAAGTSLSLTFGSSSQLTSIGNNAFSYVGMTNAVTLPAGLSTMGTSVFSSCTKMTGITIPSGMTRIENSTFSGCTALASISLPPVLQYIGTSAFYNCSSPDLSLNITLNPSADMIALAASTLSSSFSGCKGLRSISLGSGLAQIGSGAFNGCSGLTSIDIPAGVTAIGNTAFQNCTSLTSVTLPASLTTIGTSTSAAVFKGDTITTIICLAITPPTVAGGVTGNYVSFDNPATTTKATLIVPSGSVSAYQAATVWSLFTNIQGGDYSVKATPNDPSLGSVSGLGNGFYKSGDIVTLTAVPTGSNEFINWTTGGMEISTEPTIEITVTQDTVLVANFGKALVYTSTAAGSLSSVTDIATYTAITITGPINAADIAFMRDNLPNLRELDLSGATIEAYTGTGGTLSGSQTYAANALPANSFYNGTTGKQLLTLTLPATLTAIGDNALRGCSSITSELVLPSGLTSLGTYAFYGCSGMTGNLNIPTGVTSIPANAFFGCVGLKSVFLPATVTAIGNSAFSGCTGLTDVYALNPLPVTLNPLYAAFTPASPNTTTKLHVPDSSVDSYSTAIGWLAFKPLIVSGGYSLTANPNNASLGTVAGVGNKFYELDEAVTLTATPLNSSTFVNWTGGNGTVVSTSPSFTLTMTQDTVLTANFEIAHSGLVNAGELQSVENIAQVSSLTLLAGSTLDARDFAFMRDNMPYLVDLNIANASISAYSGAGGTVSGSVSYPANTVPQNALQGKSSVMTVNLPPTVTAINAHAFRNASNLTTITVPDGVTEIGANAFENDVQLRNFNGTGSFTLPASLQTIGDYAFSNLTNQAGVLTIPDNVASIGNSAFSGPNKFTGIVFPDNSVLTSVGNSAFKNSLSVTSINTIPSGLTALSDSLFYGCKIAGTLTIPEGITKIGAATFYSNAIVDLILPSSLIDLGDYAFQGTTNILSTVTLNNPVPLDFTDPSIPNGYRNPFSATGGSQGSNYIIVPKGSCSAYMNAISATFQGAPISGWPLFNYGSPDLELNFDWLLSTAVSGGLGTVTDVSAVRGMPNWHTIDYGFDENRYYYYDGQTASLQAVPDEGYEFVNWTIGSEVLGTSATLDYVIPSTTTDDIEITANFRLLNSLTNPVAASLKVYPIPAKNEITIECGALNSTDKISIYNVLGSLVGVFNVTGEKTTVDVSNLHNGNYVVKVGDATVKLVVVK